MALSNIKIISAGAGSGKTYRLTSEMVAFLTKGVRPSGIIATTFTKKAAAELQERVRTRLLENGLAQEAEDLTNALIGTVHGLGVKLLRRFAFEAGISPEVAIIADEDQQILFNQSLATVLTADKVDQVETLCGRLGLNKRDGFDWRNEVRRLTELARSNDFSEEALQKSKVNSFESFQQFLKPADATIAANLYNQLKEAIATTINDLGGQDDSTKKTKDAIKILKGYSTELQLRGNLYWYQWAKLTKLDVGAKSREVVKPLKELALAHESHPQFHEDIQQYIYQIFDIAIDAIREYNFYKKTRGLIDYTDMEVLIKNLLDHPQVKPILEEECDLLMVDEFQDTSPIQLEIFLRLSKLAKHSVWVGDPKQSIYGFRGADPKLMRTIINQLGGVQPEDIQQYSWRSRADIVYATNALFTKAFSDIPTDQVALIPKRKPIADEHSANKKNEPLEADEALLHWHFTYEGEGRATTNKTWMDDCIATIIHQQIASKKYVQPKGASDWRPIQAGDIAVLCRSNKACVQMAEALHKAGIKAAIAREGLLATAEAKLILACLKVILNEKDSLSKAEILLLANNQPIAEIIEDRLDYLDQPRRTIWASDDPFIQRLLQIREQVAELSSAEILNLLLGEMDLRRIIASWENMQQRLDNVDVLRKLALQYEEACNRLHSAASLGGFLLWINDLENNGNDQQGAGQGVNAVNVMTYHKSKGLEWPLVVCHDLENNLRASVWGFEIIPETSVVDLDNVLGNRWIRFWVNPYADQFRKTPMESKIKESAAHQEVLQNAMQEEARILYVGITRARDYLVFPSRSKPSQWLNRVWHEGQADLPTLDHNSQESPWEWDNRFIPISTTTFGFGKDFKKQEREAESIQYLQKAAGQASHLPYQIDLRRDDLAIPIEVNNFQPGDYSVPLPIKAVEDKYTAAKAAKAHLIAFRTADDAAEQELLATELIQRFELREVIKAADLIKHAGAWYQFLGNNFPGGTIHRKYPIRYFYQDQLFETVIDWIIQEEHQITIIQNSGYSGDTAKWKSKIFELGSWLYLSKLAIQEIFDMPLVHTQVNFVLQGLSIAVEVEPIALFRKPH